MGCQERGMAISISWDVGREEQPDLFQGTSRERDGQIYFREHWETGTDDRERCGLVETAPVKDGQLAGERERERERAYVCVGSNPFSNPKVKIKN
jgi:hypothetical protein